MRRVISVLCSITLAMVSVLALPAQSAFAALNVQSTTRISSAPNGDEGNDASLGPRMTPDSRYVVFASKATNLTADQLDPGISRLFLYDRQLLAMQALQGVIDGQLVYIETATPLEISDNGRFVLYNLFDGGGVRLLDRQDNSVAVIASDYQGVHTSLGSMSGDANIIAFTAHAKDDNGQQLDYDESILYNRTNNTYTRIQERALVTSVSRNGQYAAGIVPNPTNTANTTFWYNIGTSQNTQILTDPNTFPGGLHLSPDGTRIVYTAFVPSVGREWRATDLTTNQTVQVERPRNTRDGFASMSADNRYVAYSAISSFPKEVWVKDLQTGSVARVAGSGGFIFTFQLSADGSNLAYERNNNGDSSLPKNVFVAHLVGDDQQAPIVTGAADRQPDSGTWYNHDTTINWTATDPTPSSGTPTTPAPTLANQEGITTYTSGQSCDPAGNCATGSLQVALDKTAPSLGMFNWGNTNPKPLTAPAVLTVPATDATSGLARAEYFIGQTDPGQGNGTAMMLANQQTNTNGAVTSADLTASIDNLAPGAYDINVRTQDAAGNWSTISAGTLVVFDAAGPADFAASKQVKPVFGSDALPGLLAAGQNDKADLSFDVFFTSTGTVDPASWLKLDYSTGNGCSVQHPEHCDSITSFRANTIAPNSIDTFALSGTNSSLGNFQGTGTLTINGTTTTNPYKVQGIDGTRTAPASNDDVTLLIYAPGANPNTATPLYRLHMNAGGNWLKIT